MNEISRVLGQAARRLWLTDTLRTLTIMSCITLTALLLAVVVERAFSLAFPWRVILIGAASGCVAVALAWSILARRREISVARVLDERAGLKETLSTALYMRRSEDPWSKAVIETASTTAKTVRVGDALPIETPRAWPAPLAAAIAFALVWKFMPALDLLKTNATKVAQQQKQQAIVEVKADIEKKNEELKAALAKAKVEFLDAPGDEKGEDKKPDAKDQDPDAMRRDAIKKLTDLTDKLQAEKEGEKAAQLEAQKEAMRQLKQPGDGPLNEFSRSLARGDFNKAQEQLKQLTQKMADGSMSADQKAQAKDQMEAMAKQLKQLAEGQGQVAKQLEKAGLDKKTAEQLAKQAMNNPEALKKAMEQMQNLSDEQKKEMLEMAKGAAKAGQKAGKMSEAMSKMAQGMTQDGLQQEGMEGADEMNEELSDSEMLKEDMQNLDAALEQAKSQLDQLGECLGGDCNGDGSKPGKGTTGGWKPGESAGKRGSGSGQAGQSEGGASPQAEAADFEYKKEKADVKNQGGPIIGSRLVYGEAVKGEATGEFSTVVEASSREAAEAMDSMQIPREYHDAVKHYFGRLQEKVKKESSPSSTPPAKDKPSKDTPAKDAPAATKPAPEKKPG
jgi:hypothetical protein